MINNYQIEIKNKNIMAKKLKKTEAAVDKAFETMEDKMTGKKPVEETATEEVKAETTETTEEVKAETTETTEEVKADAAETTEEVKAETTETTDAAETTETTETTEEVKAETTDADDDDDDDDDSEEIVVDEDADKKIQGILKRQNYFNFLSCGRHLTGKITDKELKSFYDEFISYGAASADELALIRLLGEKFYPTKK